MRYFLSFLCVLVLVFASQDVIAAHGLSISGAPKYKKDFKHFDYVNPDAPKGGTVTLASIGGFDSLNQFILKGRSAAGLSLIYDALLTPSSDEAFSAYGLIAKDVKIARDKSSVTFQIRPEARFHDGHPIRAEDVKFTFDLLTTKAHPMYASYYGAIKSVKILSPLKVRFDFKTNKNRELPLIVGQMPILPKHYWSGKDFSKPTLEKPIGSGAYKVKDVTQGRKISYQRVADYWAKDLPVNIGRYNFDIIEYDYYRDGDVALEAFKSGAYDFRQENIAKNWASAYKFPAVKSGKVIKRVIQHENPVGFQGFFINSRKDIFQDRHVRKALTLVFDFEWMNKNFFYNAYRRSHSFFGNSPFASPSKISKSQKSVLMKYKKDLPEEIWQDYKLPVFAGDGNIRPALREGFKLLKQAGWVIEDNVLVHAKTKKPFEFEIMLVSPAFEKVAHAYARNLKKLGIHAKIRLTDPSSYQQKVRKFDFDMVVAARGQSLSPGNEQAEYWHSSRVNKKGSANLLGINNAVVDDLIEKIIAAQNEKQLKKYTQALDRVLLFGYYAVPHWYINTYRVAYWNKFAYPDKAPKYSLGFLDTWWMTHK